MRDKHRIGWLHPAAAPPGCDLRIGEKYAQVYVKRLDNHNARHWPPAPQYTYVATWPLYCT